MAIYKKKKNLKQYCMVRVEVDQSQICEPSDTCLDLIQ